MANKLPITVVIATLNEELNLRRCLGALERMQRVVVVDSGSTDATADIAVEFGAELLEFRYEGGYPKKRQWALDHIAFETEWVLLLDADEVVPPALLQEIESAIQSGRKDVAYILKKGFHFMGRRFRFGGFSFGAVLLFRVGCARFENIVEDGVGDLDMEVHERLQVNGSVATLATPLIHEDFKGLEAYLHKHNKYSTWEAKVRYQFLETNRWGEASIKPRFFGNVQERRRFLKRIAIRLPFEPSLWFAYHYIFRLGFLEGRPGLIAAQIRAQYIRNVRQKLVALRSFTS